MDWLKTGKKFVRGLIVAMLILPVFEPDWSSWSWSAWPPAYRPSIQDHEGDNFNLVRREIKHWVLLSKLSLGLDNVHVLESGRCKLASHGCGILSSNNAEHRRLLNSVNSQTWMKFFYPEEVPWKPFACLCSKEGQSGICLVLQHPNGSFSPWVWPPIPIQVCFIVNTLLTAD